MSNVGPVDSLHAKLKLMEYQMNPRPNYKVGDFIKTSFKTGGTRHEHMWVKIHTINEDSITGELNNDPVYPTDDIYCGVIVTVDFDQISEYIEV